MMILEIPDELLEEFKTFLEIGLEECILAGIYALTPNEERVARILENFLLQVEADNENDS